MPFIHVRDIDIYYETQGQGARLLYIGGSGADLRRPPTVFDSSLPQSFEVLAYDQRGVGQTSAPDAPYTMGDYAEDMG
jgi:3-oxoadipate enol-lactonase